MRPGISRVVVEIIILVIAVALALLIFSPISGYIFGSLGRTATVGGASQIQILSAQYGTITTGGTGWIIDVKNLGPGTPSYLGGSAPSNDDFKVFIDQQVCSIQSATETGSSTSNGKWDVNEVIRVECTSSVTDTAKQHSIVLYGPGSTQTQYLYYPPPS